MLRFQVITIFPELVDNFCGAGLMRRAIGENHIQVSTLDLRDNAINTHGQVDDTPYGGGSGMIVRPEPAVDAIELAKKQAPNAKVVLFSPRGKPLSQARVRDLVQDCNQPDGGLILFCARYEGVDERVLEHWIDEEISLGDYILMGGELPACALIESMTRLVPGVLGNPDSLALESFESSLLEYPQYTKPNEFRGYTVPEVLLSGDHQRIKDWRSEQALKATVTRRPDLLHNKLPRCEISVALIHYPVVDKTGELITSSVTNLDLHDIARSAKTYGIPRLYIAHPVKTLRRLAEKICEHWETGYGSTYNPNRSEALAVLSIVPDFNDVLIDIETRTGQFPKIVVTSAKTDQDSIRFEELRAQLHISEEPHLVLLGTGWGLADEMLEKADYRLEPIVGPTDYNHLSVRSAAAIIFDRLLG